MREPRSVVFEELAPEDRRGRDVLIDAGQRYFDALEQADGSIIPVIDDCTRFENGEDRARRGRLAPQGRSASVFPLGVREQIDTGYFSYIAAVRDRRIVAVDEARGLVLMIVVFDHPARRRAVEMRGVGEVELRRTTRCRTAS